jgi:glutathione S-transferase
MILYYALGACSLADHIALYEAGMKFGLVKVDLKTHKMEDGRSFYDVNPKGYVPAVQFDDGAVLTENVAILSYIADQCPTLDAPGELGRYRRLEMLAYLAAEVHKAFHPFFDPEATAAEKKSAGENVAKKLAFVATKLEQPYLFGANPTVADAYLFVMLTWAAKNNIAIPDKLKAYAELMKSRPAVQMALKHENLA